MNNESMMSEKIDSLAIALSKAQSVIENVSKDKQNDIISQDFDI